MDAESWGQTKRRAWMVRGQERQAQMAWNQGGRRHPLGSPPSAPFPKGPGATHPFSQPLGFLPHQQVALPNSRPHLAVPGSMWKAPAGAPRLDPCPLSAPKAPGPGCGSGGGVEGVPGQRGQSLPGPKWTVRETEGLRDAEVQALSDRERGGRKKGKKKARKTENEIGDREG